MIRFDNVTKTYQRGSAPALDDLTIEFERGEFAFLVGASGSGKSTMMRLILKETAPSAGRIFVAGKDLSRIPSWKVPTLRRDIGMVFQDFRLLPAKTAYQNIEFALHVIGTPRAATRRLVPEMLEMVGLADKGKRLPHELSGGEQQRVAIARAYVNRPRILLADEPTGNLDPSTAEGIMDLLDQINADGTTVIMATHDEKAVNRMGRRVVELIGGVVVRDEAEGRYRSASPVNELGEPVEPGDPDAVDSDHSTSANQRDDAPHHQRDDAPHHQHDDALRYQRDDAPGTAGDAPTPTAVERDTALPATAPQRAAAAQPAVAPRPDEDRTAEEQPESSPAPFHLDLSAHLDRHDSEHAVRPQLRGAATGGSVLDEHPGDDAADESDLHAPASALTAEDEIDWDAHFDDDQAADDAFFPESRAQIGDVDTAWDDLDFGEEGRR